MALSEHHKTLIRNIAAITSDEWDFIAVQRPDVIARLRALLDAARAEQKEDGSSVAGVQAGPVGPTDGQRSAGEVRVRIGSAGWHEDDDGDRYFRFVCALDGSEPPTWPLTMIWGSQFRLLPAENNASSPSEASAGNPATDEQNPPPPSPGGEQEPRAWLLEIDDGWIEGGRLEIFVLEMAALHRAEKLRENPKVTDVKITPLGPLASPVRGAGEEEGGSARADLSRASSSPSENPAGGDA